MIPWPCRRRLAKPTPNSTGVGKDSFPSARARVEYLFQLYEQLAAPLLPAAKPKRACKLPQGKGTPQSEADAAHFYFKEVPTTYSASETKRE